VDLDRAFDRFLKGLRGEGPKSGFPRFKRKKESVIPLGSTS
jgi:transposase